MFVKKIFKCLSLFIAFYVVVELLFFLLFFFIWRTPFNFLEINKERLEFVNNSSQEESDYAPKTVNVPWDMPIHPFLGTGNPPGLLFLNDAYSAKQSDADEIVIALTGGSLAQNLYTDSREIFVEELQKSYKFKDKKISLILLGQGTWKQPQQLAAIAYYLAMGGKLDMVINLDGHNEIVDGPFVDSLGVFIAYPTVWYAVSANVVSSDKLKVIGSISYLRSIRQKSARFFHSFRYSVTANVFWLALDEFIESKIQSELLQLQKLNTLVDKNKRDIRLGPHKTFESKDDLFTYAAMIWRDGSLQLKHLVEANEALYFHFLQPNQYVGSKTFTANERRVALSLGQNIAKIGYPYLLKAAENLKQKGTNFFSLVDLYDDVTEAVYIDNCCHVNKYGNDLMVRKIAEKIIATE